MAVLKNSGSKAQVTAKRNLSSCDFNLNSCKKWILVQNRIDLRKHHKYHRLSSRLRVEGEQILTLFFVCFFLIGKFGMRSKKIKRLRREFLGSSISKTESPCR
jgi:hypothetical protein